MTAVEPTWNGKIAALFSAPYWVPDPVRTGAGWAGCMGPYFIDLTSYDSVRANTVLIVTRLPSHELVPADEFVTLPGFTGDLAWYHAGRAHRAPAADPVEPASCCAPAHR